MEIPLPEGTQVVIRKNFARSDDHPPLMKGATGIIIATYLVDHAGVGDEPSYHYRVRLADGSETEVRRAEITILKHYQRGDLQESLLTIPETKLYEYVIFRCVTGSRVGQSHVDFKAGIMRG